MRVNLPKTQNAKVDHIENKERRGNALTKRHGKEFTHQVHFNRRFATVNGRLRIMFDQAVCYCRFVDKDFVVAIYIIIWNCERKGSFWLD